eukprot:TRINITY_DN36784_c0_g1_i1.p1 TRINITY_DN36784_c0_g1~~TRINITY_DN36784_c0_g1_i1.p1  ORF type:complete len:486 (-),score=109.10 TRINITY_DN36784_c0_g1_i1:61-1476(-)
MEFFTTVKLEALKSRYREMDDNKDGTLQFEELLHLLRKGDAEMRDDEVRLLFDKVDKDGSGTVEFDEFVEFIYTQEPKKLAPPDGRPPRPRSPGELGWLAAKTGARLRSASRSSARSSRSSRSGPKKQDWTSVPVADFEKAQAQALKDLASWMATSKGARSPVMLELVCRLLDKVMTQSGGRAFSEEKIRRSLQSALEKRFPDRRIDSVASSRIEEGTDVAQALPHVVCEVVMELARLEGAPFMDVAGQVLWRYQACEALQQEKHKGVVAELRWVSPAGERPTMLELTSTVFKELTMKNGGKMSRKIFFQAVDLLRENPVLASRLSRNDADRLFHQASCARMRKSPGTDGSGVIFLKDFTRLLLQIQEAAGVHPYVVFSAVGCHAEPMMEHRMDGEDIGNYGSSRPSSRSGSRKNSRTSPLQVEVSEGGEAEAGAEAAVQAAAEATVGPQSANPKSEEERLKALEHGWKSP